MTPKSKPLRVHVQPNLKHALGIELCRMDGCRSCGWHRAALRKAVDEAHRGAVRARARGAT